MSTRRRFPIALAVAVLLVAASALEAQRPVARGARVRIWAEGTSIVGTVAALTDSSITIVRERLRDTVEMPYAVVAGIDVSTGRHLRVWPMIGGILAGSFVGGLFDGSTVTAGDTARPAGVPSAIGMGVGALVASRFKADRWIAVSVPRPERPVVARAPDPALAGERTPGTDPVPEPVPASPASPATRAWEPQKLTPLPIAAPPPGMLPGEFAPGSRIRYTTVESQGVPRIGRLLRMDGDTMVVAPNAVVGEDRVPVTSVRSLEVSEGVHPQALRGALIGGVVGSLLYSAVFIGYSDDSADVPGLIALGIFVGAPIGAGFGAGAGALIRQERWTPVDRPAPAPTLPVAVRVSRAGRVSVGVHIGT